MPEQNFVPSASQLPPARPVESEDPVDSVRFMSFSPAFRKLIARAEVVAPHLRLATIEGEAGAGKYTLARLLYSRAAAAHPGLTPSGFHRCDAREWLLDATDPRSTGGFIYLDRVDLLASPGQALLLRILKGIETQAPASVIVVASSESSLRELAARGQFLPDLVFRLSAVQFMVPPLRERPEDIVPLGTILLDRVRRRYHISGFSFESSAIARLMQHDWPGNVRELSSVLECAVLESTDQVIREADLCIRSTPLNVGKPPITRQALTLDAVIHNHLRYVLELNHGNKLRAARQLGISRSTLYRMLESAPSANH